MPRSQTNTSTSLLSCSTRFSGVWTCFSQPAGPTDPAEQVTRLAHDSLAPLVREAFDSANLKDVFEFLEPECEEATRSGDRRGKAQLLSSVLPLLGMVSWRAGRSIEWDGDKEQIVNDPKSKRTPPPPISCSLEISPGLKD